MARSLRNYNADSQWNDLSELRCYLAYRKLEHEGFPRGNQAELCRELAELTGLETGNLSAKICNYKSIAGDNNDSNASANSRFFYNEFADFSIAQLEKITSLLADNVNSLRSNKIDVMLANGLREDNCAM